jgi:hypothetical protein
MGVFTFWWSVCGANYDRVLHQPITRYGMFRKWNYRNVDVPQWHCNAYVFQRHLDGTRRFHCSYIDCKYCLSIVQHNGFPCSVDNDGNGYMHCSSNDSRNCCVNGLRLVCITRVPVVLGNECKWFMFGTCCCCSYWCHGNRGRWSMFARWSARNLGLSEWFSNHYLCSFRGLCGFDNKLFVVCFSWFPSNVDADSIGLMYCANLCICAGCNCSRSNGTGYWSWVNNDLNSIWGSMFNKRHGGLIPVRRRNGHIGVHSIRNINSSNIAKYGCVYTVMC